MARSGRPTKMQQIHLEKELYECYIKGFDPIATAKRIGVNRKTAYRYYNQITDEIAKNHKDDYFERVQENLEQIIQGYDYLLQEEYSMLDDINVQLKDAKSKLQLFHSKSRILKEIKNIIHEKAELRLNLPHHGKLEEMIEEKIKDYVKHK